MKILSITGKLLFESNHDSIKATLEEAVRQDADLRGAYLSGAHLRNADLRGAYLSGAYLRYADLSGADLSGADLSGAVLSGADLSGADLRDAKNIADLPIAQLSILPDGDVIGWKKCLHGVIVKLLIPKEAKRSNATGRKCRAEYAKVLEVIGSDIAFSQHDKKTSYKVGEIVKPDSFDPDRWNECSSGIHFFITRTEAENY